MCVNIAGDPNSVLPGRRVLLLFIGFVRVVELLRKSEAEILSGSGNVPG